MVQYVGAPTSGALPKYALLQYYTVKCVACQRCQRLVQSACVHVTLCELLQVRARTCNPGLTYYIRFILNLIIIIPRPCFRSRFFFCISRSFYLA